MTTAKHTQEIERQQLLDILAVARDGATADLRIDNVKILNLLAGGYLDGPLVVKHGTIVGFGKEYVKQAATKVIDGEGKVVVPGFIDSHMHIESSIMTPHMFEVATLPTGLTTVVVDPHELINVMGSQGLEWFLRCATTTYQNQFIQLSSCIPALPRVEVNGAEFTVEKMLAYRDNPHVLGLAEMMNFPGVVNGDALVLDKLQAFSGMIKDGHAPLVSGRPLDAYIAAGINNDHECTSTSEALEKLAKGMAVFIRESSAARNLNALAPIVNEFTSANIMLCTDDRNPHEITTEGHLDMMVRRLIKEHGVPAHVAYRVSSFSAAQHFGLKRLGLIAPGRKADFLLLNNVDNVDIAKVFVGGKDIAELDLEVKAQERYLASQPPLQNTIIRKEVTAQDFSYPFQVGKKYRVLRVIPNEIITGHEVVTCIEIDADGNPSFDQECCLITCLERYGQEIKPAIGLCTGTGLTHGGLGSSVGHDSHNLLAIGKTKADLAGAINAMIASHGGFVVYQNGKVTAELKLPVAGLLSDQLPKDVAATFVKLKEVCAVSGVFLEDPFMQLAFLSLPVIPALKLTCNGLFDVEQFKFVTLEVEETT